MRIGVLEDDPAQVELYKLWFSTARHECTVFGTIAAFLAGIGKERFDLLLVDWLLPDGTGEQALKAARETLGWDVPIICVTLRDAEQDIVNALRVGADDYVVKPPKYFELLARIESLARRSRTAQPPILRLGAYEIVYIPDSGDTSVYVMGAVPRPGAYRLTPDMSLLDALAQAGGPNEDAATGEIAIYRPGKQALERVPLQSLLTADRRVNYALEEGDIVYVPKSGLAEVGYVLRQLAPGLGFMTFGLAFR